MRFIYYWTITWTIGMSMLQGVFWALWVRGSSLNGTITTFSIGEDVIAPAIIDLGLGFLGAVAWIAKED